MKPKAAHSLAAFAVLALIIVAGFVVPPRTQGVAGWAGLQAFLALLIIEAGAARDAPDPRLTWCGWILMAVVAGGILFGVVTGGDWLVFFPRISTHGGWGMP